MAWDKVDLSGMDPECVELCRSINMLPGIETVESCCGHGDRPLRIWFTTENVHYLPALLYWLDGCHSGHYGWKVIVTTDCAMSPATFMIVGPTGKKAYEQSKEIAYLIRSYVIEQEASGQFDARQGA